MMQIRQAGLRDCDSVRDLYLFTFPEIEREAVAALAINLLTARTTPETFALVAETDDILIGHIAFSPVTRIDTDKFLGYILAPLAVHPEFQQRRIGTNLIKAGMEYLAKLNVDIVFVYGDPQFYSRFGFDAAIAAGYLPPYQLRYPLGWQAKALTDVNTFPAAGQLTCVKALREPQLW